MRPRRALETAAEKAGWGKPLAAGRGRGIAQHSCFGTYVAQVADVTVKDDGTYTVDRVVAAVDCGPVVNPGPLVAQIEGAITMGLSTVLKEEVMFEKGGVKSSNFDDYDLIRMSELPEIEVHMIKSTEKIGGIGEPGVPPLATPVFRGQRHFQRHRCPRAADPHNRRTHQGRRQGIERIIQNRFSFHSPGEGPFR